MALWGNSPSLAFARQPQYPLSLLTAFAASSPKGTPLSCAGNFIAAAEAVPLGKVASPQAMTEGVKSQRPRPLRRSRARFPFLSPSVTSSPGAGEVFPQRESQAVKPVAKVLGIVRKLPAVLLPLPLGEVAANAVSRRRGRTRLMDILLYLRLFGEKNCCGFDFLAVFM